MKLFYLTKTQKALRGGAARSAAEGRGRRLSRTRKATLILAIIFTLTMSSTAAFATETVGASQSITVSFRLIGDTVHGLTEAPGYCEWIPTQQVMLTGKDQYYVYDAFVKAVADAEMTASGAENNYVKSITKGTVTLGEFDNGSHYSGWKYFVNGVYAPVGLGEQVIRNGDIVVWHYINDYLTEDDVWAEAWKAANPAIPTLQGIELKSPPTKTSYKAGEKLNLKGLVVTAHYSSGATAEVTFATPPHFGTSLANGTVLNTEGVIPVTVTYQGKITTFDITVAEAAAGGGGGGGAGGDGSGGTSESAPSGSGGGTSESVPSGSGGSGGGSTSGGTTPVPDSATGDWKKQSDGTWKYVVDGAVATGWQQIDGKWYYLDKNKKTEGAMKTGWQQVGGKWYYLDKNKKTEGVMKTGWQQIGGKWYYLDKNKKFEGVMKTGWVKDGGSWYLLSGSGQMLTGWQKSGKTWYYFGASGKMLTGTQKIGGKTYTFSSGGAWIA
ncbi:MAG: bacterial Ig-like domain-containing protein, partial [Clostridiales Family XIII bacterium]|jgi:hypothetical protein|nr:bacterial Ig-like domain-containing protein [Clostridiales Family XIII bacterium]